MHALCPNCQRCGLRVFYDAGDVTARSCVMSRTLEAALQFPRRRLALGFCSACGFIANAAYDATLPDYANDYEDQQSFSPRFRAYQSDLITRLVERYDVRNKDVLEIGCGKGDFLLELCRAGGNRGVGIDPRCPAGRVDNEAFVRFLPDYLSEAHSDLPCDLVCCLHTLEHIHATHAFAGLVRRVVGDRTQVMVWVLVPDVGRVLREQAFWDVYYEHCSYFSPGSLSRVFRANRFDVVEIIKVFDGQYLLMAARPAGGPTTACLPEEDDLEQTERDVRRFAESVPSRVERWRRQITALRKAGKRVAIWGSGSKGVSFLSTAGIEDAIDAVVDINPHRHGKYLPGSGKQVLAPEALQMRHPDVVFVMNPIYCQEIRKQIEAMGIKAELIGV